MFVNLCFSCCSCCLVCFCLHLIEMQGYHYYCFTDFLVTVRSILCHLYSPLVSHVFLVVSGISVSVKKTFVHKNYTDLFMLV